MGGEHITGLKLDLVFSLKNETAYYHENYYNRLIGKVFLVVKLENSCLSAGVFY